MECPCCIGPVAGNPVRCTGCGYTVCVKCQKQFLKPECMSCHTRFTRRFLVDHLSATFVKKTLRQHVMQELLQREKLLLPAAQPHVNYERIYKEEMAKARWGHRPMLPVRPSLKARRTAANVFRCTRADCKGFVQDTRCGVCGGTYCSECRELKEATHTCDPSAVDSIRCLTQNTKPCPQCATPIERSAGCSHINCTFCKVHFDWITMQPINNSTNGHYRDAAIVAHDLVVRNSSNGPCETSVPRDVQPSAVDPLLLRSLYEDREVVRYAQERMFSSMHTKYEDVLMKLRVRFLEDEITEKHWAAQVYTADEQHDRQRFTSELFLLYQQTAGIFQSLVRATPTDPNLRVQWDNFVECCNQGFVSLREEYGGPHIALRRTTDSTQVPPLRIT